MSEEFIKSLVEKRHKMLTGPANVKIEEIDFPDSDKDSDSDEDMQGVKPAPLERTPATMTKKEPPSFDIAPLENEILEMCKLYKNDAVTILMKYNYKPRLSNADIADIRKNIGDLNEIFEDNLGSISHDLPQGVNFSDRIYDNIDATADNVARIVNQFIMS